MKVDDSLKFICKECFEKCNNKCPFCRKENPSQENNNIEIEIREAVQTNDLVIVKKKSKIIKKWLNCFVKYSGLKYIKCNSLYFSNCSDCCFLINNFLQSLFVFIAWSVIFYIVPFFICQKGESICPQCIIVSFFSIIFG